MHGTDCVTLPNAQRQIRADSVTSKVPLQVCTVMTADCLPVLFCDTKGEQVAAAHAGWRGLCDGVLENTVTQFTRPRTEIMAWLGPAISVWAFEVGDEVREQFLLQDPNAHLAFIRSDLSGTEKKWFADLYLLAKQRLQALGVTQIFGGEFCTYGDPSRFFSYRRDGQTGRQASCIWLTA